MDVSTGQASYLHRPRVRSLSTKEVNNLKGISRSPLWHGYRLDKRASIYCHTYLKVSDHPHILLRMANCISTSELNDWGISDETTSRWPNRVKYHTDKGICVFKYLGKGSCGSVKFVEVYSLVSKKSYLLAAKKIKLGHEKWMNETIIRKAVQEAAFQHRAGERLALPVYWVLKSEDYKKCPQVIIVMGLSEGITVSKALRDSPVDDNKMPRDERKRLALKFAEACKKLHDIPIVHRDLKLGNMSVNNMRLKVLDFGMATSKEVEVCGYRWICIYSAPELTDLFATSRPIDVFSEGAALLDIIGDGKEFTLIDDVSHRNKVKYHVFNKKTLNNMERVIHEKIARYHFKPFGMNSFIRRMLSMTPEDRPTVEEVYRHFLNWYYQYDEWT